jgi:hypothetical protein
MVGSVRRVGVDDDGDCGEHVWVLTELHLTLDHAGQAHACTSCGAIRYDDAQEAARPALGRPLP